MATTRMRAPFHLERALIARVEFPLDSFRVTFVVQGGLVPHFLTSPVLSFDTTGTCLSRLLVYLEEGKTLDALHFLFAWAAHISTFAGVLVTACFSQPRRVVVPTVIRFYPHWF